MHARCRLITRRQLLGTVSTAVAAPYLITSRALGNASQPAASDRITTALIGSGDRGMQIVEGGDKVLAVCDVDATRAALAKKQIDQRTNTRDCTIHRDYREILARDDIDAVVIATPDHWHATIAIAAIQAGKAVYVEKPMTLTIEEGQRLVAATRRYGAIVQVGSQQRSLETFIRACEYVRNGRIGKLELVRVDIIARAGGANKPWTPQPVPPELDYDSWLGPAPWTPYHQDRCHYNFRFVSDYSGGDVTNWGAHHLDIAQWGIGADDSGPVEVEGHGKRNPSGLHDTFYDVNVDFRYANGVRVELRCNGNGVRFQGSDGWIYVSRTELKAEPRTILETPLSPTELRLAPAGPPKTHMERWLDCVRARSPKGLNATVDIGHRSGTVCHLANIAMELGRKLTWDPVQERFVNDPDADRLRRRPNRAPW
jgi:predicted dehydrogenase